MKLLQFNADRGRVATIMAEKKFLEGFDVALIQEPYKLFVQSGDYARVRLGVISKAEIWVKRGLPVTTVHRLTDDNYATIRIGNETCMYVTSIYDEPGGAVNRRLEDLTQKMVNGLEKHLLAGDINAHCRAWGEDETDARGEGLLAWSTRNGYEIVNDRDEGPTFQTTRGQSYIDVTLAKGVTINEWRVKDEETLSGHRYITFSFQEDQEQRQSIVKIYDFRSTNWEAFRQTLRAKLERQDVNAMGVEERAEFFQKICRQTCQSSINRREASTDEMDSWYDRRLAEMKSVVQRKRRRWQNSRTEEDKRSFKLERNKYKRAISEAKEKHLAERLANTVDSNPWHRAWKLIAKKKVYVPPKDLEKDDGTFTNTENESNEYLLRKYFPQDDPNRDTPQMRQLRNDRTDFADLDEPEICEEELLEIIKHLKKKKATSDKIPNEAMTEIYEAIGQEVLALYRKCWEEGVFPKVWKKASIVWIPKKNGAPRPISLLPTLGKILDKMINKRLQNHLELTGSVSRRQFAYRQGLGTVNALKECINRLREAKDRKEHIATIALDLSNAFNSAWTPYLAKQMKKCGIGRRLGTICMDFLADRKVNSGAVEMDMEKGCPQGSSLGPTLWNIIMEGWFETLARQNRAWKESEMVRCGVPEELVDDLLIAQAYADDQLVMIKGSSARVIEEKWSLAWRACKEWELESNTSYNIGKTEVLFAEKDNKPIRPPIIKLDQTQVETKAKLKYLGVVIDKKLSFVEHVKEARRKVEALTNKVVHVANKTYGRRGDFVRTVVERVIKPAALYAAEVWGGQATKSVNKRCLTAAQRPFLLASLKAYRTTSNAALQVLNGTPPWWLEAKVLYDESLRNKADIDNEKLRVSRLIGLPKRIEISRMVGCGNADERITYVDASGTDVTTGLGYVTLKQERRSFGAGFIPKKIDTDKAEELAVWLALRTAVNENNDVIVATDRLGTVEKFRTGVLNNNIILEIWHIMEERKLRGFRTRIVWAHRNEPGIVLADRVAKRAGRRQGPNIERLVKDFLYRKKVVRNKERTTELLMRWQEDWDTETKGREVYRNCREVGLDRIGLSFKAVQLVTGHGNLREYERRFALRDTDGRCECGAGPENSEHVREQCTRVGRMEIRSRVQREFGDRIIQLRRANVVVPEQVRKVELWAEGAMDVETFRPDDGSSDED